MCGLRPCIADHRRQFLRARWGMTVAVPTCRKHSSKLLLCPTASEPTRLNESLMPEPPTTTRTAPHSTSLSLTPEREKARLDRFLAIWQRRARAAWPKPRCADAVTTRGRSEGTWAAARATSPASRANLRPTALLRQSCSTRSTKRVRTVSAPVLMPRA